MQKKNIYSNLPENIPVEIFEVLAKSDHCKVERIISRGQKSPENFWYDQDENEWVLVLKGRARLRFEQNEELVELNEGEYLNIPAHCKHHVEWTDPNQETIWLAVFY